VCSFFQFVWTASCIVHWKLLTWKFILDIWHECFTAEKSAFKVLAALPFRELG
jgi:hypothetical protein